MKKYGPIGRCIYCSSPIYSADEPARKFGDEHIIPDGLGGDLLLLEASCKKCESKTSGLESLCIQKLFDSARPHFQFARDRGKLKRTLVPVRAGSTGDTTKVPISDHPGTLMMFKFDVATTFTSFMPPPAFVGEIVLCPVVSDFGKKVAKVKGLHVKLGGGIRADTFGRFLAKIAHSYVVAKHGIDGFIPCLQPVIIGEPPYDHDLSRFVGSSLAEEPVGSENHEIEIIPRKSSSGQNLIVARIRLFARQPMPVYYVVAGTPL